jgi:hypothetical protein
MSRCCLRLARLRRGSAPHFLFLPFYFYFSFRATSDERRNTIAASGSIAHFGFLLAQE